MLRSAKTRCASTCSCRIWEFLESSIGKKIMVASAGILLSGFLVTHLAGNLLFFVGPDAFNQYGHTLVSNPLIYVAEVGLIGIFVLHIGKTLAGFLANRAARPQPYAAKKWAKTKNAASRKSLASTTMRRRIQAVADQPRES